jgi:hypothetical protein
MTTCGHWLCFNNAVKVVCTLEPGHDGEHTIQISGPGEGRGTRIHTKILWSQERFLHVVMQGGASPSGVAQVAPLPPPEPEPPAPDPVTELGNRVNERFRRLESLLEQHIFKKQIAQEEEP